MTDAADITSVSADLIIPDLSSGEPSAGRRVRQTLADWPAASVQHVLYLPVDWIPGRNYPVIVEFAGNGGYDNAYGDRTKGCPEESKIGYGVSAGRGCIWLCLPFLDGAGKTHVRRWWGSEPDHDPRATVDYVRHAVAWVCRHYGGDASRVLLAGFSRGAIACHAIGLHDDQIARLWRAFVLYSHYEGVREWPYPESVGAAPLARLRRLGSRPQFICHENDGYLDRTRAYVASTGVTGNFTFEETGFRNHNDAWLLRPSPARVHLREWVAAALA